MNRMWALMATGLVAAIMSTAVSAAGDPDSGRQKSQPCQACHGETGQGVSPMIPKLAGQYQSYLVKTLKDYRDGKRANPAMSPFAASLSDQDIKDLAAWFSSQQGLEVLSAEN